MLNATSISQIFGGNIHIQLKSKQGLNTRYSDIAEIKKEAIIKACQREVSIKHLEQVISTGKSTVLKYVKELQAAGLVVINQANRTTGFTVKAV